MKQSWLSLKCVCDAALNSSFTPLFYKNHQILHGGQNWHTIYCGKCIIMLSSAPYKTNLQNTKMPIAPSSKDR